VFQKENLPKIPLKTKCLPTEHAAREAELYQRFRVLEQKLESKEGAQT
jgi:hypothetical protein